MSKNFKRMLAMIFAIIMTLGVIPYGNSIETVEAAFISYDSTVIYLSEFEGEQSKIAADVDKFVKNTFNSSSHTNIEKIKNGKEFIEAWNYMPSNQKVVVIDTHGDPSGLCGIGGENIIFSSSMMSQLKWKNISYIVLLGCNCGHYDKRTTNIARAFSDRFGVPVIASDGTVLTSKKHNTGKFESAAVKSYFWGTYYESWAKYNTSGRSDGYGWLVYTPKNSSNAYQGKLYQISRGTYTVYELLNTYSNKPGYLTPLSPK